MDTTLDIGVPIERRSLSGRNTEVEFLLVLQIFIVIGLIIAYFGIPIMRDYIQKHQLNNQVGVVTTREGF